MSSFEESGQCAAVLVESKTDTAKVTGRASSGALIASA
jgi:hypothetical protein